MQGSEWYKWREKRENMFELISVARDPYYKTIFCHTWNAIKLWQDFDALCEMLSDFYSFIVLVPGANTKKCMDL